MRARQPVQRPAPGRRNSTPQPWLSASHADHRRCVAPGGERAPADGANDRDQTLRFRASRRDVAAATVAETILRRWLHGGHAVDIAPHTVASAWRSVPLGHGVRPGASPSPGSSGPATSKGTGTRAVRGLAPPIRAPSHFAPTSVVADRGAANDREIPRSTREAPARCVDISALRNRRPHARSAIMNRKTGRPQSRPHR